MLQEPGAHNSVVAQGKGIFTRFSNDCITGISKPAGIFFITFAVNWFGKPFHYICIPNEILCAQVAYSTLSIIQEYL